LQTLVRSQSEEYTDGLLWLAKKTKNWLIIMDNADDPSLEIPQFLPRCAHGHVIITTRNHLRKTIAPKSTHLVDSLPLEEATTLLLDASGYEDNGLNRQLAGDIAEELGCLPLAIAHAGAYILVRECMDTYLDTYRKSRTRLLEHKFELSHDYPHSVATTIKMSLEKISFQVQELIGLLSYIGTRSIPRTVIKRAASRQFRHVAYPTSLPLTDESLRYASTLMSILCPRGVWNEFEFDNMVEECEKYSLLRLSTSNGEKFYSIHVLVQAFVQSVFTAIRDEPPLRLIIRLLGSAITHERQYKNLAFNQLLALHLRLVDLDDMIEAGDHYGFGYVLEEVGEGQLALSHMKICTDIWMKSLGNESEATLSAMELLACSYIMTGKEEEGMNLREKVVKMWRKIVGEDHLCTLAAMQNLAVSYSNLGKHEQALALEEGLLDKWRKVLGEDHLNTLTAMQNLAATYSNLGRDNFALKLEEKVLEKLKKIHGEDHLDTLSTMQNLAATYSSLYRDEEVLALEENILEKRKKALGEDHSDTLAAMQNLAVTYSNLGRDEEAMALEENILDKWKKAFGEDHLDTLGAMQNLAASYSDLGRDKDALVLEEEVLKKTRRILGEDHLDTLIAMQNLAVSYSNLDRDEEALALEEEVLDKRRRLLGKSHCDTINAMQNLVESYLSLGRGEEALALGDRALKEMRKVLGERHQDTLAMMQNLMNAYLILGRVEEALALQRELLEKKRSPRCTKA
jgi:hypothetical protein